MVTNLKRQPIQDTMLEWWQLAICRESEHLIRLTPMWALKEVLYGIATTLYEHRALPPRQKRGSPPEQHWPSDADLQDAQTLSRVVVVSWDVPITSLDTIKPLLEAGISLAHEMMNGGFPVVGLLPLRAGVAEQRIWSSSGVALRATVQPTACAIELLVGRADRRTATSTRSVADAQVGVL